MFDDDYDDDDDRFREDDTSEPLEEAPLFGCACENAICVDTMCDWCIEWMKEQVGCNEGRAGVP